jgi:hypothetical protein
MSLIIFRRIIYNSTLNQQKFIEKKRKYMLVNKRPFYSFPNGPEEPNYIILLVYGIFSYYTLKYIHRK